MDRDHILEELERKKQNSRILSKKILLIFSSVFIITAVLAGVFTLISIGFFKSENIANQGGFLFDPNANENYDIFTDPIYASILESEPLVNLGDARTGVTGSLLPENYETEGAGVKLMTDLIKSIQMGDSDAYNSLFSRAYLISEGKKKAAGSETPEIYENYTDDQYMTLGRQRDFTMQQIYSVYIILISEAHDNSAGTATYVYELEYKIRRNNGSFRTDIGSDAPRTQEITVFEDKKTGKTEIVSITTFSSVPLQVKVHGWRIALIALLSVLIITADIIFTVKFMKNIGKSKLDTAEHGGSASEEKKDEETVSD